MLSLFEAMTGPMVRTWHMRLPDPSRGRREEVHKVQLRHFPLTGHSSRSVTVDGIAVQGAESAPPPGGGSLKKTVTLKVRVGSHDCWVGYRASARPGRYFYSCIIDGVVMPELNDTVGDTGDDEGVPLPGEVFIDSIEPAKDRFGTEFLEFRVVTLRGTRRRDSCGGGGGAGKAVDGGGGCYHAVVWRRFSAFRSLHSDVTAMLWGSHLLDSLPPLPAKCINPLVNQMGAAFLESRREVLQAYLRRLLEVPKARASVNLMGFLGLHPITGYPLPWAALAPSTPRQAAPLDDEGRREL
ncbi:hypothetical protein Esi_0538_0008 [Ectocarpus siliculosus]|uniref:PX domain-containing protein n=1 Tax=Ectocarpus siliculosus TaxID=2880 RepID=D8LPV7_ECTSI|nr:hypothetical protein Esi_0538_0008 [Ectocarpus siliculosus]|eukprot:CBN79878.1 hypothetical protein Esi_0538_0008 [Ectocarpus siliculosus]